MFLVWQIADDLPNFQTFPLYGSHKVLTIIISVESYCSYYSYIHNAHLRSKEPMSIHKSYYIPGIQLMSTSAHSDVAWESVHIKQLQRFDLSPKPLI